VDIDIWILRSRSEEGLRKDFPNNRKENQETDLVIISKSFARAPFWQETLGWGGAKLPPGWLSDSCMVKVRMHPGIPHLKWKCAIHDGLECSRTWELNYHQLQAGGFSTD